MFDENFSFEPLRSPSLDSTNSTSTRNTSRSVSPCSAVAPLPSPPPARLSISELASQFAGQRIHQASQVCYDSCEAYANLDDNAGWQIDGDDDDDGNACISRRSVRRSRTFPQRPARPHSPSQRLQRQANARLLCSASHHRDISALVARMVESSDQCSVSAPPEVLPSAVAAASTTSSSSTMATTPEDEGYDSCEDGSSPAYTMSSARRPSGLAARPKLLYRRSSDMKTLTGACVSKTARQRKDRSRKASMVKV